MKKRKFKCDIDPKNDSQVELIKAIESHQMVITTGYPGTGKTFIPTVIATDLLTQDYISKIILTRPNVAAGKPLGFRPGTLDEKFGEWFLEIRKLILERVGHKQLEEWFQKEQIEMVPFETMRGRSFDNAFVILDEAQNTTPHEMKMFVTRIGNAQVVVNGDLMQSDLKEDSGLKWACLIRDFCHMDVPVVDFGPEDIVRGDLCKEWIINWIKYECQANS